MQCELEFKKLMIQTDMSKVEPLYYTGLLIMGITCALLSTNWLSTVLLSWINTTLDLGATGASKIEYKDIIN